MQMMNAEEIINILKKNKLLERRTFTERRSDTLPMGCLHRKDFPTKSEGIKSPQLEEGGKGENRNFPLTIVQRSVDDEC